jgi:phenylacetate-CoA ligase
MLETEQLMKLNKLLNHAYKNIGYYTDLLNNSGLVEDGKIKLQSIKQLSTLPLLTKEIITQEKENLYSNDIQQRKAFRNTSGGSTGKPVVFMQDENHAVSNMANSYLARSWRGASLYDDTVVLWGAERDTFEGKKPLSKKIKDYLLNTLSLNTFVLNGSIIKRYIEILNRAQPKLIIAYVQSIYTIAKYAKKNGIKVDKQNAIHAAAGTVHPFMREEIESVFSCKVYNHYGSREAGTIASECSAHNGLHIMMEHTLVEIINDNGAPCEPGETGNIIITTLNNYSMPLIRYKIGDLGVLADNNECPCNCNYPMLKEVAGRNTDRFITQSGAVVMPEFFIHLIGVVCNRGNIKLFQVIQETTNHIRVKIVKEGDISKENLAEISEKIEIVMGKECKISFEFVDDIPKTSTGKYLYTISKVQQ